jgi:hypothetical protein
MNPESANQRRKPTVSRLRYGRMSTVMSEHCCPVLHQHIARLCVLFEDLRIEIAGMSAGELGAIDQTGKKLRYIYFLRRSIATLVEFSEALRLLNAWSEFDSIKQSFGPDAQSIWTRSVTYLDRHDYFKLIRNDIGGHFGSKAARYAIENFLPFASGAMEVNLYGRRGGAKLMFASEIAATALMRHLKGRTSQAKVQRLFRRVLVAYRHAVWAVDCISVFYLWDRFGK